MTTAYGGKYSQGETLWALEYSSVNEALTRLRGKVSFGPRREATHEVATKRGTPVARRSANSDVTDLAAATWLVEYDSGLACLLGTL